MKKTSALFIILFALTNTAYAKESFNFVTMEWPYQTQQDGKGLYFDIIKSVYEPAGIEISYDFFPFKRAKYMVQNHRSDAIVCGYKNDQKPGDYEYLFPKWHLDIDRVFVIFKKSTVKEWNGQVSLTNKVIGWQRGYDYFKKMLTVPIEFHEFDHVTNGLRMLQADRFDFIMGYKNDINISSKKIPEFNLNDYQIEPISIGKKLYIKFANTEHSKKLITIFDNRMEQMFESGELDNLFKKWGRSVVPK